MAYTKFKLVAVLNSPQPGRPGLIHVRPKIGKASATFYLDPQIELTPASTTTLMASTHKSSRYAYEGTETTETSIVRSGGTAHSRKIVTTANSQWLRPYRAEPYAVWNDTTGADVTVTVYGTYVGAIPLNDEFWMDVEYLNSTHGTIVTTTKANVLATGVAVSSDSSTWTGWSATSFDGTSVAVVLSNGNLTVLHNVTTTNAGAVSTAFRSAGKFYFEVTCQVSVSNDNYLGVVASTFGGVFSISQMTSLGTVAQMSAVGGYIFSDNSATGINLGATAVGDVFCFAIDLDNRRAWIRRNSGNWNNSGAANPATNVGGVTMASGVSFAPICRFAGFGATTDQITANFGAGVFTAPSGFGRWSEDADTPFKLVATLNGVAPAPPTLPSLTGLIGWWDASVAASLSLTGSAINSVADQSGGGNHLNWVNAKPTYSATGFNSNMPAIVLGSSSALQATSFPMGTGNTLTMWYVGTLGDTPSAANARIMNYSAPGFDDYNSTNSWGIYRRAAGETAIICNFNSLYALGAVHPAPHRLIYTVRSDGWWTIYVDGVIGTQGYAGATNWASLGLVQIGRQSAAIGNYWTGPLAEAGIATGHSDATMVAALDAYLAAKWGLTTPAPVVNPQPGQPGLINVRVKAAKPSATFYLDPVPVLS